ncbi:DNA topoisomerase III [Thiothrix unzii]|jgi:DNA topoisomerase-3|uniref:DNA topoisomerase III n=1 Tax=Thiothrix unzii TaxID=111769 RepID=UPI002A36B657|nr:DNA topoisomerase III [Thiothrix unzii]MDX9987472.1 DNA topoisomerase III [Thiothrix unzii]
MLYVCEKPSQARDIAKVLGASGRGDGYLQGQGVTVTWCFGHLLEQAEPEAYGQQYKRWSLDALPILPEQWILDVKKSGAKQFKVVKALLGKTQHVVIATDADREGEMIAREVMQQCHYRGQVSRLWLSALDDASIKKALGQLKPGHETEKLYQAGLARSRADWLVGMNLSRAYTLVAQYSGQLGDKGGALSVGRVQTPTLKLVVDRDRQIHCFVPVDYWDVQATCLPDSSTNRFKANWIPVKGKNGIDAEGRCLDSALAQQVVTTCQRQLANVLRCDTERKKQAAPLPYDLSGLQVEASRRWGLGAQQVLDIAQALYEKHKLTTYPRTDCGYLPVSQHAEAAGVFKALVATDNNIAGLVAQANHSIKGKVWDDGKITAHHGIIPTAATGSLEHLSEPELFLYDLIRRRYLAQFFPAHEYDQTVIELDCQGYTFRASGRVDRVAGWKTAYQEPEAEADAENEKAGTGNEEAQTLPKLVAGDSVLMQDLKRITRQTKPPAPYTEGTLIQAMKGIAKLVENPKLKAILRENAGIGTEATRANIIETLLHRKLLERVGKKKQLRATPKGAALIAMLPDAVKDPALTAAWEQALESIASGEMTLMQFMDKQQNWLLKVLERAKSGVNIPVQPESVAVTGGADAATMTTRGNASSQQAGAAAQDADGKACPVCGKPMLKRNGKYGDFWGCSGFPGCKTIVKVDGA